jgi:hypothetical protein
MQWKTEGNKLQTADTEIKFHLVVKDINDTPVIALSLANKLHKLMHGKGLMKLEEQLSTGLMRTESDLKKEYDQLKIIVLTYATTLYDCSAMDETEETTITLNLINE